jgi:hypothetical protein
MKYLMSAFLLFFPYLQPKEFHLIPAIQGIYWCGPTTNTGRDGASLGIVLTKTGVKPDLI